MTAQESSIPLFRSAGGKNLHLRGCPHFQATDDAGVFPASDDDIATYLVCKWSADEIAGVGRRYFDTLDAALEAYHAPVNNRPQMRAVAAELTYDKIWMPQSGSYIGIALGDSQAQVYFGKTYIWRDGVTETLPGYTAGAGGGTQQSRERAAEVCPTCHEQLPATGRCDNCA